MQKQHQQLLVQLNKNARELWIACILIILQIKIIFNEAAAMYRDSAKTISIFKTYNCRCEANDCRHHWKLWQDFLGYYNPFTGEAQVNTNVPAFVIPFTTCHEMAHQIGYASESEASFVGFLVIRNSNNADSI